MVVDKETIEKLSLKHIGRFAGRISAAGRGSRGIRVDECRKYMALWKSIKKKGEWDKLNTVEKAELMDAVYDEKE
jgi:hypothetical protein